MQLCNCNNNVKRRILIIFFFFIVLLLGGFLFLILSHNKVIYIPCFFHEITGLYCPGCGMTRAFYSFVVFDFKSCFHNNLLLLFMLPAFIYYLFCFCRYYLITGKILPLATIFPRKVISVALVIVVIFGILRNFDTFSWLQPLFISI